MFFKKHFFDASQRKKIVEAIAEAESLTSGEIRVHVEPRCTKEPMARAVDVFHHLNMHKTEYKNGVLIYLAWKDKKLAIIGDSGIDKIVPADFWDSTKEGMRNYFKTDQFTEGVLFGISETGIHLQKYFPNTGNDKNELSNEISEG